MVKQIVEAAENGKIRCDACPVMCFIADGRSGACDRYANEGGELIRVDPLTIIEGTVSAGGKIVPFMPDHPEDEWNGDLVNARKPFITAVGAGTTYPDYKPAPFIVSQKQNGVDMVTVVTEGIFSYCGAKVKIDTDRFLGPEAAAVRVDGEPIGHVMTGEYGSQMLSLGGVHHLTGGSKKEGRVTCDALLRLCNSEAVEMVIDGGANIIVQAGKAPIINGAEEHRMRVGCGSATIGMFAKQWKDMVDEVVVVDDHITGVLSEHQAGKLLNIPPTGIKIKGRRSTPGRYFQVAGPGTGWGGTNIDDPLIILGEFDPKTAYPGLRMLMVSTTGEQYGYYILDDQLKPELQTLLPAPVQESVEIIAENCEPALATVLFMGGAGGSLRAGVTTNPVRLTRSVKEALTHVSCGGAPAYVWPGGGITVMADVTEMPTNSFGYVPTPALVAPIEFTMRLADYEALGGHMEAIIPIERAIELAERKIAPMAQGSWPTSERNFKWSVMSGPTANYIDGDRNGRLHLQHGPIDLIIGVDGAVSLELEAYHRHHAFALANRRFQTVLEELVGELPLLKSQALPDAPMPDGRTARRMMAAVLPFAESHFITPMAAVAGSVADEVLAAMLAGFTPENRPRRIYVNNGGDIALHLDPGAEFRVGMSCEDGEGLGAFVVDAGQATRGVATSGRGGRSLSMGIADSVTILACNAAEADAAASLVANAVDLPGHPQVTRGRAIDVVDDSDLGEHLVVTGCGELGYHEIGAALEAGAAEAERFISGGLIHRAALFLKDRGRIVDPDQHDTPALESKRYA